MADTNTKLLDTIDLTGDEPVITTEIVKEVFVDLMDDEDDDDNDDNVEGMTTTWEKENNIPVKKVRITNKKCEVCLEEASKYTCPACKMRTCSLDCVVEHKHKTKCSGERSKSDFVGRKDFSNFHLLNDYRFLEEVTRVADNARRDKKNHRPHMDKRRQALQRNIGRCGVMWYGMAIGMKREKENRTRFDRSQNMIRWMVKLIFVDVDKEVTMMKLETDVLGDMLAEYVDIEKVSPEKKIVYSQYVHRGDKEIKMFFRNELDGGDNCRYTQVNLNETIKESLEGRCVLEYPVFHLVLDDTKAKEMMLEVIVKEKEGLDPVQSLDTWLTSRV